VDEGKRTNYYQQLRQPMVASSFTENIRQEMIEALTNLNQALPDNPEKPLRRFTAFSEVAIYFPFGSSKGLFKVRKPKAQPEPPNLFQVKEAIQSRYGMLDLLDVFIEADRLVDFTRFFTHSGTREVRSREALRPLILLDLFGEGTNLGIKRIAKKMSAKPSSFCEYLVFLR